MSTVSQDEIVKASFFSRHGQKLIALLFWVLIFGSYLWYVQSNNLTVEESMLKVAALLTTSAFGALLYILIYALRALILFPATVLTVLGGFLFGPFWGVTFTIIGANLSAMVAYLVGRFFGKGLLSSEEGSGLAQKYADRIRENSFESVLIMRLIFLPYDLVNYLSGFLRIDWKAFLLATIIGSLPGTISFVLLGSSFGTLEELLNGKISLNPTALIASVVLILASIALSQFLKRREPKTPNGETKDEPTA
ncbi:MAG: TVP38/TMEM64 family protein [Anaerolineales bacterium]|nr:TVP38/TMEM64 family protein [Anaerolineales bacterium]